MFNGWLEVGRAKSDINEAPEFSDAGDFPFLRKQKCSKFLVVGVDISLS